MSRQGSQKKQSLISDHRDHRPTQTRVAKSHIKLDHISAALNRKNAGSNLNECRYDQ